MKKWTNEEISKLIELCEAEISNKAIAAELGRPVTDIYAKRSQMRITIDKIKEKKQHTAPKAIEETKIETVSEGSNRIIEENKEAIGGYRLFAEMYFSEPKNNREKTIKSLLKGAAKRLEITTEAYKEALKLSEIFEKI